VRTLNASRMSSLHKRWLIPAGVCLLLLATLTQAAIQFPTLSGRVVDNADLLSEGSKQRLTGLLEGHENATSNQVVIVTLADLAGLDIASYGYQLGRHWGIGQKDSNNGVLLIVAQSERKVRIEVGYGLEGSLTDAISSNIINGVILPAFKKAQFESGIELGATAIIQALGGEYKMQKTAVGSSSNGLFTLMFPLIFMIIVFFNRSRFPTPRGHSGSALYVGSGGIGGGRSGGFSGGGFSGGGGGFGGGGASGGW
jgi:uncharacterized protein